jgi:hypothetical protein
MRGQLGMCAPHARGAGETLRGRPAGVLNRAAQVAAPSESAPPAPASSLAGPPARQASRGVIAGWGIGVRQVEGKVDRLTELSELILKSLGSRAAEANGAPAPLPSAPAPDDRSTLAPGADRRRRQAARRADDAPAEK